MTAVAFLGLGAIGDPMARQIAQEDPFTLAVWNRTAKKAADFAGKHRARHAETPADAARGASVVVTCLPTSADVEALLDGPNGLEAGFAEGAILVDCTSGDPATSQRIAARLAKRGVGFLDAPVSGGVAGAEIGTLTVMVGGDEAAYKTVEPVLRGIGTTLSQGGEFAKLLVGGLAVGRLALGRAGDGEGAGEALGERLAVDPARDAAPTEMSARSLFHVSG